MLSVDYRDGHEWDFGRQYCAAAPHGRLGMHCAGRNGAGFSVVRPALRGCGPVDAAAITALVAVLAGARFRALGWLDCWLSAPERALLAKLV